MDYSVKCTVNRPSADVLVLTVVDTRVFSFSDDFRRTPETSTEQNVVVDFDTVQYFSSSALGQILGLARRLKTQGRSFVMINLKPEIAQVFQATRLDRVISVRTRELVSSNLVARTIIEENGPTDRSLHANEGQSSREAPMPMSPTITDDDRRFAADWKFAQEQLSLGAFEPWAGKFLGIYNRKVVVMGDREADLRHEFATTSGISGSQLAVLWIDNDDV